jgi:hypothetical protein
MNTLNLFLAAALVCVSANAFAAKHSSKYPPFSSSQSVNLGLKYSFQANAAKKDVAPDPYLGFKPGTDPGKRDVGSRKVNVVFNDPESSQWSSNAQKTLDYQKRYYKNW